MARTVYYLIFSASKAPRVVSRYPYTLRHDEIAYKINVTNPGRWGHVSNVPLDLRLPDAPNVTIDSEPILNAR